MSFSKHKKYEWEIIRGCSLNDYVVVCGVNKLFKYFLDKYKPSSVFSCCDYNKFTGISYEKLDVNFTKFTVPDMKYILEGGSVVNRSPHKYKELENSCVGRIFVRRK